MHSADASDLSEAKSEVVTCEVNIHMHLVNVMLRIVF